MLLVWSIISNKYNKIDLTEVQKYLTRSKASTSWASHSFNLKQKGLDHVLDDTLLSEFTFHNVTFTFINLQKMTPEFKFLTLDYLRSYFIKIIFFIKTSSSINKILTTFFRKNRPQIRILWSSLLLVTRFTISSFSHLSLC